MKRKDKTEVLTRLLDYYNPKGSIVFCNTKRMVDELSHELTMRGYFAEGLHGDMKQAQRDRVMANFRTGKTDILIATDVAARGLDIDYVEAVFNYDIPQDDEYYVHRIGRTGRAGRAGKAFSFVRGKEVYKLKDIMRYCKTKIFAQPVPSSQDVAQMRAEKVMDKIETAAAPEGYGADSRFSFGDTGAESGMVRLFINIGKKQKVKPGDILGAVAGESGISGDLVGAIDMYDKFTFVEVPLEYGKKVLQSMSHAKIKGKEINIEPANGR